jgi:hypothetical protein
MLPKTGMRLRQTGEDVAFATMVSDALTHELGKTHQAVKIAMRWTGASERSVKHWLAGTHAPRGRHLVALLRHSDEVLRRILIASDRLETVIAVETSALRPKLQELLAFIDQSWSGAPRPRPG